MKEIKRKERKRKGRKTACKEVASQALSYKVIYVYGVLVDVDSITTLNLYTS